MYHRGESVVTGSLRDELQFYQSGSRRQEILNQYTIWEGASRTVDYGFWGYDGTFYPLTAEQAHRLVEHELMTELDTFLDNVMDWCRLTGHTFENVLGLEPLNV